MPTVESVLGKRPEPGGGVESILGPRPEPGGALSSVSGGSVESILGPRPAAPMDLPGPTMSFETPANAPAHHVAPAAPQGLTDGPDPDWQPRTTALPGTEQVQTLPDYSVPERTAGVSPALDDAERDLSLQQKGWENLTDPEKEEVRAGQIAGMAAQMGGNPSANALTGVMGKTATAIGSTVLDGLQGKDRPPAFFEVVQQVKHAGLAESDGWKQRVFGEIVPRLLMDTPAYLAGAKVTHGWGTFSMLNAIEQVADKINVNEDFDSTEMKMAMLTDAVFKLMPAAGLTFKATGGPAQAVGAELGNIATTAGVFTGLGAVEQWANNQELDWDAMPAAYLENVLTIGVLHSKRLAAAARTGKRSVPVKLESKTQNKKDWSPSEKRRGDSTANEMIRRAKKGDKQAQAWVREMYDIGIKATEKANPQPKAEPQNGGGAMPPMPAAAPARTAGVPPAPSAVAAGLPAPQVPVSRFNLPVEGMPAPQSEQTGAQPSPQPSVAEVPNLAAVDKASAAVQPISPESIAQDMIDRDTKPESRDAYLKYEKIADLIEPEARLSAKHEIGKTYMAMRKGYITPADFDKYMVGLRKSLGLNNTSVASDPSAPADLNQQVSPAGPGGSEVISVVQESLTTENVLDPAQSAPTLSEEKTNGPIENTGNALQTRRDLSGGQEQSAAGQSDVQAQPGGKPKGSPEQQTRRAEFARLAKPVDEALSQFVKDHPFVRAPAKADPLYGDLMGPSRKDGGIVPRTRFRKTGGLHWDDMASVAREMIPHIARPEMSDLEVLAAVYNTPRETVRSAEKRKAEQADAYVVEDMQRSIAAGEQPPQWMQAEYPDLYKQALDGSDPAALKPVDLPDDLHDEFMPFLEAYEGALQSGAIPADTGWQPSENDLSFDFGFNVEGSTAGVPPATSPAPPQTPNPKPPSMAEWRKQNGIEEPPQQDEMFGKGAVGDAFELRPETVKGTETFAEKQAREAAAKDLDKRQESMDLDGAAARKAVETSIETYKSWINESQKVASVNGWTIVQDDLLGEFVAVRRNKMKNDAGGGPVWGELLGGFAAKDDAVAWAKENGKTVPEWVARVAPGLAAKESGRKGMDLDGRSQGTQSGGFVATPDAKALKKVIRGTGRLAKRWLHSSEGLDKKTRALNLEKMQGEEAAAVQGMLTRAEFRSARKMLTRQHGRANVQEALESVVYGETTPQEFAQRFALPADHAAVKILDGFNTRREKMRQALATVLEQTGNPSLAERVRENEAYVSRFYLKHAMGDEFSPKPEDYKAAVTEVRAGIEDLIERLGKRASKASGKSFQQNVLDYLNTGNESALDGLSKSRRQEIVALGRAMSQVSQVVTSVEADGDGVALVQNVTALQNAAAATVDYYLTREPMGGTGGTPDVSNLKKRFLGEAFRKLYGEVRDPIFAAATTAENQARMLSQLTFFNHLAQQSQNVAWSKMPSDELGTTKKLEDDRKRYGLLANSYVTPELYRAIHGDPSVLGVTRVYRSTLGTMRMLKLVGPKTIARNYATALTGFALGSGDMMRKGYWKHYNRGNKLVAGIVKQDPAALAELRDLVQQGVFSVHGNTMMEEVQKLFTMDPRKKSAQGMKKLGELYSLIDLPSKVASYYTNLDRFTKQGMPVLEARKAAAAHVQRFYQNPKALPRISTKLSHLPISDYPGYFFDAARIRAHQFAYAGEAAKQGDMLPGVGLLLSGMLTAGLAYGFGKVGRELWRKARQALRRDDEEVLSNTELGKKQSVAMRAFLPDYYESAPLILWKEDTKDGTKMYYTVTGGQGAFPLEDMIIGSLQGAETPQDFLSRLGTSVKENRFGPGMLASSVHRALTGDDLRGGFHTTGPQDVQGRVRPDKDRVYRESAIRLLSDVYGGQFGTKLMQMYDLSKKQEVGAEPVAGSYVPYQTYAGILGSMADPARTYEINVDEAARMVRNRLAPYKEGLLVSKGLAGAAVRDLFKQGAATERHQQDAEMGQAARAEYIAELGRIAGNAQVAFEGVLDMGHMVAIVKGSLPGASELEIMMILGGTEQENVVPYQPKPKFSNLQQLMMQR